MKITEALLAEHTIFVGIFDEVERLLPRLTALGEITPLATLIEGMLKKHGDTETELAYLALDHVLAERGELNRLHQEHQELDASLKAVSAARSCDEARRLLLSALKGSREHFRREERTVFPMLERVLQHETLAAFGNAWLGRSVPAPPTRFVSRRD
jgi:hemerythrin-like domain-containing protein